MAYRRPLAACAVLAACLLCSVELPAQVRDRTQWQLIRLVEAPPPADDVTTALATLGLRFEDVDKLLELTEAQKRKVVEAADAYRREAWEQIVTLAGAETRVVLRRFVARYRDIGCDLALLELTDKQAETLIDLGRRWRTERAGADPDTRLRLDADMTLRVREVLDGPQVLDLERIQVLRRTPTYVYVPFTDGRPGKPLVHRRYIPAAGIRSVDLAAGRMTVALRQRPFAARLHQRRTACLVDGKRVDHDKLVAGRPVLVLTDALVGRYANAVVQSDRPLQALTVRLVSLKDRRMELAGSPLKELIFDDATVFRNATIDIRPTDIDAGNLLTVVLAGAEGAPVPLVVLDHGTDRGLASTVAGAMGELKARPDQKGWFDLAVEPAAERTLTVEVSPSFVFSEKVDGAPHTLTLAQLAPQAARLHKAQIALYGFADDERSTPMVYQAAGPDRREQPRRRQR